jgi:signal peptidase
MSALRHIARGTATLITGVAVLAAIAAGVCVWAGYRPQPVLTGSMAPKMPVGSLAVAKPVAATTVRVGDVITFQRPDDAAQTITHRVVAIHVRAGRRTFETQGDNNPAKDPWVLALPGQVGLRVAVVPYAGYAAIYAGRPAIHAGAVGLMALLMLLGVLRAIWRKDEPAPAPDVRLAGSRG